MDLGSAELISRRRKHRWIINCLPWIIDACNETDYESFKLYTIAKADAGLLLLVAVHACISLDDAVVYVESPQLCLDYFNIVQPCDVFSLGYHRYYVTRNYAYQLIQHFFVL